MAKTIDSLTITCSICGHAFDPAQNRSCGSCPLHQGCATACCPNCGVSNINPAESKLARRLSSFLGSAQAWGKKARNWTV